MPVSPINGSNYIPTVEREIKQDLDKDAFLQLLVTQLANQDPTNPMEDREFIAQMAQFSALEQMVNLNDQLKEMSNTNEILALSYIGRLVAFYQDDGTESAAQVQTVWFDNNLGIVLETDKGSIKMDQVIGVA